MNCFTQYIVTKRIKKKTICGEVNLPFGTLCTTQDGVIYCGKGALCGVTSQDAYDYFTQNDDGQARQRRKLIDGILDALKRDKQSMEAYNAKWEKVWSDPVCLKYKRKEYEDYWLWNYDFYNAKMDDLRHIAKLVDAKEGQ